MKRVQRTHLQKCLYRKLYQCRRCGSIHRQPRTLLLWFGGSAKCPLCGGQRVTRAIKREPGLVLYWNPINLHLLNDWGIVEGRAEAGVLETQSQR